MNSEGEMPFILPPALVARLEEAAQADGMSLSELVQDLLERREKDRSWQALVERGRARGAALLPPDADEEAINDLVNAKIAESRREQRGR